MASRLLTICLAAFLACRYTPLLAAENVAERPEEELFGLTKVHSFELELSAEDYAAMEPAQTGPFGGFGPPAPGATPRPGGAAPGGAFPGFGPPEPGRPAPGSPDFGAGNFGFEFDYVKATFRAAGETLNDVGIRYKGSGTYMMSARQAKRSFKIDFDRYNDAQRFYSVKKLNLNSGVMDPTKAREALAYSVFRAAGLPACRTAFATVTLTVPGKYDDEFLGVYTVVEQVDKPFLKAHFGSSKGLLLKPEGIRGLPYFGEDASVYAKTYIPKTDGDEAQWKRLVDLTRLANHANDGEFQDKIGDYLDLDAFARFMAANTMLASLDGFLGMGHNYYLYLSPKTDKFTFFPWDLDLAFGAFGMYGGPEQLATLSIEHPHLGENKLIDRVLAIESVKSAYREELRKLASEVFTADRLVKDAKAVESALEDLLQRDKTAADARRDGAGGFGPPGFGSPFAMSLPNFIERRAESVLNQLAGKEKGYTPMMGFPGGFGGPPAGQSLAKPLLEKLDADKNNKISAEEWAAGFKELSSAWDEDRDGELNQRELDQGLQKLMPAQPFGPRPGAIPGAVPRPLGPFPAGPPPGGFPGGPQRRN